MTARAIPAEQVGFGERQEFGPERQHESQQDTQLEYEIESELESRQSATTAAAATATEQATAKRAACLHRQGEQTTTGANVHGQKSSTNYQNLNDAWTMSKTSTGQSVVSTDDLERSSDMTRDEIIERYGPWSAMSIQLPDGSYTMDHPLPDRRLRRILRSCVDLSIKPLDQLRVLDLACLEGHYGIEFAMQGVREVIGVDIREGNIAKSRFVAEQLGLTNIQFLQADVLELTPEKIGTFDIVICSGIFYHIHQDSLQDFATRIAALSDHLTILDTFVSSRDVEAFEVDGRKYYGRTYIEHQDSSALADRIKDVWASVHNTTSFWLTPESLINMFQSVGYTSLLSQELPTMAATTDDRKTYIAIKGQSIECKSSALTNDISEQWLEHVGKPRLHSRNQNHPVWRRAIWSIVKLVLPKALRDFVRPVLVRLGLQPDVYTHIRLSQNSRS